MMKQITNFVRRDAVRLMFLLLVASVLLMACSGFASAAAAEEPKGWVEVKSTVPVGFNNDYLVLQAINKKTGEEVAFQILAENNYVLRTQIPVGEYMIDIAFVYQDYRYSVTSDVAEFTVVQGVAAPINLTVMMLDQYRGEDSQPTESPDPTITEEPTETPTEEPTVSPSTDPAETPSDVPGTSTEDPGTTAPDATPEPSDPNESASPDVTEKPEKSILERAAIAVIGTVAFCSIIFLAAFLIRRTTGND